MVFPAENFMTKAIVLFSGGQDSSTCLLYALSKFDQVFTIGFSYGQRHDVEMICRQNLLETMKRAQPALAAPFVRDVVVTIPDYEKLSCNALTGNQTIAESLDGLPATFVPARNLLFLCYAAAFAYGEGAETLICGVGETDYSGYPDCRAETLASMQESLSLGLGKPLSIEVKRLSHEFPPLWEAVLKSFISIKSSI